MTQLNLTPLTVDFTKKKIYLKGCVILIEDVSLSNLIYHKTGNCSKCSDRFYILPENSCMCYLSFKNGFNHYQKIQIRRLQGCLSNFCICTSGQYQRWNFYWYKKPVRSFIFDYFHYDWFVLFNSLGPCCLDSWSELPCLFCIHLV